MTSGQLQTALIALLPKDGTTRSATWLASVAGVTVAEVKEGLQAQTIDKRVQSNADSSEFWIRKGNA